MGDGILNDPCMIGREIFSTVSIAAQALCEQNYRFILHERFFVYYWLKEVTIKFTMLEAIS